MTILSNILISMLLTMAPISVRAKDKISSLMKFSKKNRKSFKNNINDKLGKLLSIDKETMKKRLEERRIKKLTEPVLKLENFTKEFVIRIREENAKIVNEFNKGVKVDDINVGKILGLEEKRLIAKAEEEKRKKESLRVTPVSFLPDFIAINFCIFF